MKTIRSVEKCCEDIADNMIIQNAGMKSREDVIKLVTDTMADYLQAWNGQTYRTIQCKNRFYSVPIDIATQINDQETQIRMLQRHCSDIQRELNIIKS